MFRCIVDFISSRRTRTAAPVLWIVSRLAGAALFGIASAGPSLAHDALPTAAQPNGWTYPFACCSGYDCREVSKKAISERPEGYVILGTGEVLPYTDTRVKNSPDGEFHWCSVAGANNGRTICLFVPPRGY